MDAEMGASIESAMAVTQAFGSFTSTGSLVVNIVLGASLSKLWKMINTLQFVVFFTDWNNLYAPPNAMIAIDTFKVIALGEFMPKEDIVDGVKEMFGLDGEEYDEE